MNFVDLTDDQKGWYISGLIDGVTSVQKFLDSLLYGNDIDPVTYNILYDLYQVKI